MTFFNTDIVRMDKNISYHYTYLRKYSQDDGKLMFMLLVYFAKLHQQDLFGNGSLDPVAFCKEHQLSPQNYIWAKHPNPRQLTDYSREHLEKLGMPIFDTVFENSLYCLYSDIFQFPKGKFYLTKHAKYQNGETIDSIQFITSLTKRTVKVGKTLKKMYIYELSEKFISNLSFLFFNINTNSFTISSKKNNDGLYFYITNLVNEMRGKNVSQTQLEFDEIKDKLNINSDEARYVKKKIKKAFDDLKELEDLRDIDFQWFRLPNHRFEYGIILILTGGAIVAKNKSIAENSWKEVKTDMLKYLLFSAYKRRYPEQAFLPMVEIRENYTRWLKNPVLDADSKRTAYVDYTKNTNTPELAKKVAFLADGFPNELAKNYQNFL